MGTPRGVKHWRGAQPILLPDGSIITLHDTVRAKTMKEAAELLQKNSVAYCLSHGTADKVAKFHRRGTVSPVSCGKK